MSKPDDNNQWDDLLADLGLPGEQVPEKPAPAPALLGPPAEVIASEPVVEATPRRGRKRPTPVEAPTEPELPVDPEPVVEMESDETSEVAGTENADENGDEGDPKRRRRRGRRKKKVASSEDVAEDVAESPLVNEPVEEELEAAPVEPHGIVERAPMLVDESDDDSDEYESDQGTEEPLEFGQEESDGDKKRRRRRRRKKKGSATQAASTPTPVPAQKIVVAPRTIIEPRDLEGSFDTEEEADLDEGLPVTHAIEDDEDDEIIDMSNWNIISWQDLIGGLYRPDRDR